MTRLNCYQTTGLSTFGAAGGLLGIALSVETPFLGVVRVASAFGLQPGKLIAEVANTGSDESAHHQAAARYRVAREFEDFTRALERRPLVVFIDDLDRCRAPNVVETLEAVNSLVTSGRCIVVLGMARHWVETCVGLAFKELFLSDATTAMQPFLQQELTRRLPDAHQRDAVLEKLLHAVDELNMRFTRSRLFADPTLDSRRARAFITLLALDTSAQAKPQLTTGQTHTAETSVGQIYSAVDGAEHGVVIDC